MQSEYSSRRRRAETNFDGGLSGQPIWVDAAGLHFDVPLRFLQQRALPEKTTPQFNETGVSISRALNGGTTVGTGGVRDLEVFDPVWRLAASRRDSCGMLIRVRRAQQHHRWRPNRKVVLGTYSLV